MSIILYYSVFQIITESLTYVSFYCLKRIIACCNGLFTSNISLLKIHLIMCLLLMIPIRLQFNQSSYTNSSGPEK